MPGAHELPRRKQRGIKIFKGFYQFLAPQAAGYYTRAS